MALMLIKRHLWLYVMENNFLDSSFLLNQALEFNNAVVLFFDRAIYFTTTGYMDELSRKMEQEKKAVMEKLHVRRHYRETGPT